MNKGKQDIDKKITKCYDKGTAREYRGGPKADGDPIFMRKQPEKRAAVKAADKKSRLLAEAALKAKGFCITCCCGARCASFRLPESAAHGNRGVPH